MALLPNSAQQVGLDHCHKIYVERDYSQGLEVKFCRNFPPILDGLVEPDNWYYTIDTINKLFELAESVNAGSVGETLFGFFTCYLVRLCTKTRYEKKLVEIRRFIDEQNQKIFVPAGFCITDPIDRGFRVLEISVLTSGYSNSPIQNRELEQPSTSRNL
ncbi:Golgin subfamily A member 7 [Aphelenchoides bicaudatus]|nr:Golgin subfamily A member 7 [Aphelenchoides bicaudatus]